MVVTNSILRDCPRQLFSRMTHLPPDDQFDLQAEARTTLSNLFYKNYEMNRREYSMMEVEVPSVYNSSEQNNEISNNEELARDAVFHCIKSNQHAVSLSNVIKCVGNVLITTHGIETELAESLTDDAINWFLQKKYIYITGNQVQCTVKYA